MYKKNTYKYRSLSGITDKTSEPYLRLRDMLVNRKFWFAKPSTLNDPFDCLPHVKLSLNKFERIIKRRYKQNLPPESMLNLDEGRSLYLKHFSSQKIMEALDQNAGVFCLGETPTNSTLWTYYGAEHSGICIELDPKIAFCEPLVFDQIRYSNDRPRINAYKVTPEYPRKAEYIKRKTKRMLFSKGNNWKHEQEVRVISPKPGLRQLSPGSISAIYFGARTSEIDISIVLEILKLNALPIPCFKVELSQISFNLEVRRLD